jgi:predicted Zn-dependent peptidase
MRRPAMVLALAFASCGGAVSRPYVVPLRYADREPPRAPSQDAPFRVTAPIRRLQDLPSLAGVRSFVLANGLHVVVVERPAFPTVAARLSIDTGTVEAVDVGGRRAFLLGRVFLSSLARVMPLTTGDCDVVGCAVVSRGPSNQLADVLGRIANRVTQRNEQSATYEQRFTTALRFFDQAESPVKRNASALLFGDGHRYGQPPSAYYPTLDELDRVREQAFVPSASTLVVVGRVTTDAVKAEAMRQFGAWPDRTPTDLQTTAVAPGRSPPPPHDRPRVVACYVQGMKQVLGAIVVRGPPPQAPDRAAFEVLAQLLGGAGDSIAFHQVREGLGAAYSVNSSVQWYPDASVMTLAGSFSGDMAISGMKSLLDGIRGVREGVSDDDLDRARNATIGMWRSSLKTNEGVANVLGTHALLGGSPEQLQGRADRLEAVDGVEVRAAAQRYLPTRALRIVLIGEPDNLAAAEDLGFGAPAERDRFGRPP